MLYENQTISYFYQNTKNSKQIFQILSGISIEICENQIKNWFQMPLNNHVLYRINIQFGFKSNLLAAEFNPSEKILSKLVSDIFIQETN